MSGSYAQLICQKMNWREENNLIRSQIMCLRKKKWKRKEFKSSFKIQIEILSLNKGR